MKNTDIEKFIKEVTITREQLSDSCEYEVTKKAMNFYNQYPLYNDWSVFSCNQSLPSFLRNRSIDTKKPREKHNYKGAYLLKSNEDQKCLTADIITSIKSPINLCLKKYKLEPLGKNVKGAEIQEKLFKNEIASLPNSLVRCAKAFAIVYYWCGNMLPVICNPLRTGRYCDNWMTKMKLFLQATQENTSLTIKDLNAKVANNINYKQLWPEWIHAYWFSNDCTDKNNVLLDIIEKNYLRDFFYIKTDNNTKINSPEICVKSMSKSKIDEIWFLENTKLIIQRSYRIHNNLQNSFTNSQINDIEDIFKYVFNKSGVCTCQQYLEIV